MISRCPLTLLQYKMQKLGSYGAVLEIHSLLYIKLLKNNHTTNSYS